MKDLSSLYPVTKKYTYLNTASCGLLSEGLVKWRQQHDINLMEGGSLYRDLHKTHIKEIRKTVAGFFSTQASNVALVPNFSFGMNTLLDGISKGQKVLLLSGDYPSVNWPFENRDFDVCYATIDDRLEENILEAILKYNPDILAFSVVQYISGILIELDFIKELKRKYPQLLIIADGTQFLGTSNFNFEQSGIDVLGASTYKWMLSGYGNGFFMIKEAAQEKIRPQVIGFNSADASFNKRDAIAFVGRFEPGHQDTLNYGTLGESIKMMEHLGKNTIQNHLSNLTTTAKDQFSKLGLLDDAVIKRSKHSTIFNLKGDQALFEKLKQHHIICSLRGKGIRVSFHIYNTQLDLRRLLEVINA